MTLVLFNVPNHINSIDSIRFRLRLTTQNKHTSHSRLARIVRLKFNTREPLVLALFWNTHIQTSDKDIFHYLTNIPTTIPPGFESDVLLFLLIIIHINLQGTLSITVLLQQLSSNVITLPVPNLSRHYYRNTIRNTRPLLVQLVLCIILWKIMIINNNIRNGNGNNTSIIHSNNILLHLCCSTTTT